MNWTRYKLLIISGGISLVVSGVLLFWILKTGGQNEDVSSQIQNLRSKQTQLASRKPFPSQKNFEQLKEEQAKVIDQRDQLLELIRTGQMQPEQVGRAYFGEHISKWVKSLREQAKEAKKGGEHGVILKDPDFGLTDYLQGLPPETDALPDLMLDLVTMEHISLLLFESGISELVLFQRKEEAQATRRGGNRPVGLADLAGFGPSPMPGQGGLETGNDAEDTRSQLLKEKERLFDREDYRVEFRVYEDFLWDVLNKIVSDPNQFVIKELTITNSNETLWPKTLEPGLGREKGRATTRTQRPDRRRETDELSMLLDMAGGRSDSAAAVEEKVQIPGLSERRQNVVGGDLLNVVMLVRVYRLADQTEETEEGL